MSAIEAVTRTCKTMSDGTLRLTVDISPIHAQDAFKLFGMPDVPMAIARLNKEAAKQSAQDEIIEADKPKGGQLAKLAGMWCQEVSFYNFIRPLYDKLRGGNGSGWGDIDWHIINEEFARHAILVFCDIESRAELDNNPEAAEKFHRLIRIPYMEYLKSI